MISSTTPQIISALPAAAHRRRRQQTRRTQPALGEDDRYVASPSSGSSRRRDMVPMDPHNETHPTPFGGERTTTAKASIVYRRSRAGIALPSVLGALAVLASAMHAGCVLYALVTPFWTGPRLLQGDMAIVPGYDDAQQQQQQQQEQQAANLSTWMASTAAAITSTTPHAPTATTATPALGPYERRLMLPVTELLVSPYYYCINVHQPPDEVAWWVNVQASAATRTINEDGHLVLELNGAFIPERHALLCELRSDHRLRVDSRFEETYYDLAVHSDDSFNGTGAGKDCRRTAKEQRYLAAIVRGVIITSGLLSALSVTVGVALVALLQISSRKELHHRRRRAIACCRPSGGAGALLLRIVMLLFSALAVAASIGGIGATMAAYSPECSEDAPCQFLFSIAHRLGREGNYSQSLLDAIEVAAAGIGGTVTDGRGVRNINASALPALQCEVGMRSSAFVYHGAVFLALVSSATTLFSLIVAVWAAHAPPVAVALNATYHDRERRPRHRHQEGMRDAASRAAYAGAVQNEIAAHTRSLSVSECESSDSGSSDGAFYQEDEEDEEEEMVELEAQPLPPRDVTLSTRSIVQAQPPTAASNGRTNSVRPRPTAATTAGHIDTSHTQRTTPSSGHRRSTAAPPESLPQQQPPQSPVGGASTAPCSDRQLQRAMWQGTTDMATRGESHHPRVAGDRSKPKASPTAVSVGAGLLSTAPPPINNATVRTAVITTHPKSAHHTIRTALPRGHHADQVPHSAPVRGGRWKRPEEVGSAGEEPSQQVLSPSTPAATSSASASGGGANGPSTSSSNRSSARNHKNDNAQTQEDRKGKGNQENLHSVGTHRPRANNASPHGTQESGTGAELQQQHLPPPVVTFEPPAGGDWEWDSNSNMYWSDTEYLFLNPASGHFYDPNSRQWFNPDSGAWYAEDYRDGAQHAHGGWTIV